jgi:hypothetical protein
LNYSSFEEFDSLVVLMKNLLSILESEALTVGSTGVAEAVVVAADTVHIAAAVVENTVAAELAHYCLALTHASP